MAPLTIVKECARCAETFVPRRYSSGRQKYCSPECAQRQKAERKRVAFQRHYAENRDARVESSRQWARANPEKMREHQRRSHLKRKFGMTLEDYDAMLASQRGRCAICGSTSPAPWGHFSVDHCHTTGKVRGLLCRACNTCIGQAGDNPDTLRKAISYLEAAG